MTDTTLSDLFPFLPLLLEGEALRLRPVIFRELPLAQRAMEGWLELVGSGGVKISPEAWEAFLDLLAGAAGRTRAWVQALPEAAFESLVCHAVALNRDLWDGEGKTPESHDFFTWASIAQRLIEHGHPWEAVQDMTLGQMRTFLGEALHLEREGFALDITAASFSMADADSVKKATKELRRG